jgi:gluconokinase
LGVDQQAVKTVFLRGGRDLLHRRLAGRQGHFMNPGLLGSQLDVLEPPAGGITVDIEAEPDTLVERIVAALAP